MIRIVLYSSILLHIMYYTDSSDPDSPYSNVPPPRFVSTPTNFTVRPGDSVILPCSIQHLGTKRVVWRQVEREKFLTIGTQTWVQSDNFVVQHEEKLDMDITVWNLYIKRVTQELAGEYECQTTAIAGHSRRVYLQVVGSPITEPVITGKTDFGHLHKYSSSSNVHLYGSEFVEQGQKIHLICNATGGHHIPEEIDWFLEGEIIEAHKYKDIVITKYRHLPDRSLISELIVDHSDIRHAGTYICRSSQNKIDKLPVSVLVAETDPRKRGTGDNGKQTAASSGGNIYNIDCILLVLLTMTPFLTSVGS